MDDNSDTDSVAELEYIAWDNACAGEFQNILGNIPPTPSELEYKIWEDDAHGGVGVRW